MQIIQFPMFLWRKYVGKYPKIIQDQAVCCKQPDLYNLSKAL